MKMLTTVLFFALLMADAAQASELQRHVVVFVMPDGDLTIDKGPILSFTKFKKEMEPLLSRKPCVLVDIKSDLGTPFEPIGRVVYFLQRHHYCGKTGFITEPAKAKEEAAPAN